MRHLLACLLLALSLPATAQIYSYTDADGNTSFTNDPPAGSGAQSVALPTTNSMGVQPPSSVSPQPSASDDTTTNPQPNNNPAADAPSQVTISPDTDTTDDNADDSDNTVNAIEPRRDEIEPRERELVR